RHLPLTTRVQPPTPRRPSMKTTLIASAMAAAVSLAATGAVFAGPAAVPGFDHEKCYGVAKAGKNDCQTATHSCAGTATQGRPRQFLDLRARRHLRQDRRRQRATQGVSVDHPGRRMLTAVPGTLRWKENVLRTSALR